MSIAPKKISEKSARLRNVILPFLLPKEPDRTQNPEYREYSFSNQVLVGNWYENRLSHIEDKKAISPSIYGTSSCMKDKSLYQSDFKQHVFMQPDEDYADFVKWKQYGFSNYWNSTGSNISFNNGDQFFNNFTSFKDIMYRIMPKQDVNSNVLMPRKEKVNNDYMRSFGNSTRTGLMQWKKCQKYIDNNTPIDMSHYKNTFKPIKIDKPATRSKGPQRKTSLIGDD